uniref:CX domain-containing protein n=1 Tax=Caenorhabditis tropicalis TaxID=1561998 RepID=A0A1I7SY67_9PELO
MNIIPPPYEPTLPVEEDFGELLDDEKNAFYYFSVLFLIISTVVSTLLTGAFLVISILVWGTLKPIDTILQFALPILIFGAYIALVVKISTMRRDSMNKKEVDILKQAIFVFVVFQIKYDESLNPITTEETVTCGDSSESGIVVFDLTKQIYDRICPNFFDEACYNCSMHPEYYMVYCRCKTPNCNNPEGPLPYPIPPNTVTCYVSGYDAEMNHAKYTTPDMMYWETYKQLVSNESYYDEGRARMPHYNCSLDYEDGLHCYCGTDFCNTPSMFHGNITILPIIECKDVFMKEYRPAACNKCIWRIDYVIS